MIQTYEAKTYEHTDVIEAFSPPKAQAHNAQTRTLTYMHTETCNNNIWKNQKSETKSTPDEKWKTKNNS